MWSKQFQEENGNTEYILICNWFAQQFSESETLEDKAFLLAKSSRKLKNTAVISIPEECPLNDYKIPQ